MTIPREEHQSLIDALSAHVLLGHITKEEAERIIRGALELPPSFDEAILFQLRKDYGLDVPGEA